MRSISRAGCPEIATVIVVDNGEQHFIGTRYSQLPSGHGITRTFPGSNLGWAGGVNLGLRLAKSEFVMMLNDDTEFEAEPRLAEYLISHFSDDSVGAVGPATGSGDGPQASPGPDIEETKCLVGFCLVARRDSLLSMGGLDSSLTMGDDIDLSIRLSSLGKRMVIDRRSFVYHHGFKTGYRIYGSATKVGGWNSREMVTKSMTSVLDKHGSEAYLDAINWRQSPDA